MSKETPIEAFIRINQPRAKKAADHIDNIRKSGKSLKISRPDIARLLAEHQLAPAPVTEAPSPHINSPQRPPGTPWVDRKREDLEGLPTVDLIDIALACALIIAERRK